MKIKSFIASIIVAASTVAAIPTTTIFASTTNKDTKTDSFHENYQFSTAEVLDRISKMDIQDPAVRALRDYTVKSEKSIPHCGEIKRYYMQKGPNPAFILGIYYIPSPIMYEVIQAIELEIKNGNRAYIYNGQFYASPEEDPTFISSMNRNK